MNFPLRISPSGIDVIGNNGDTIIYDSSLNLWKTGPGGAGGAVSSVFGRTGVIVAISGDYDSDQVDNLSNVSGSVVSDALDNLNISGGFVSPTATANFGATPALNFSVNRYIRGILNVNAVPTLTIPVGYECWLELIQPAVGGKLITSWPAIIDWTDSTPPTLSTGNNAIDLLGFISNGTNLRGYAIAMNVG